MNINSLFPKQAELDKYIYENNNVTDKEVFERKIVAFLDELFELANELQFFKYWKKEIEIDRQQSLEEYIDVVHFALSIAISLDISSHEFEPKEVIDLNKRFLGITNLATVLSVSKEPEHATALLNNVLNLGHQLGLDEDTIIKAYNRKNEVNHKRQDGGY